MKSTMSRVLSITGEPVLGRESRETWGPASRAMQGPQVIQAPVQGLQGLQASHGLGARLRVLVFDDASPARNHLVKLIETTQLAEVVGTVASANEAREALEAPDGANVDVAFVDLNSTHGRDGGGLELVRSMAGSPQGPAFVLATAAEEHAALAFELGVADYVLKPFHEERIAHCLRRVHDRRKAQVTTKTHGGVARVVARKKKSLVFLEPEEIWAFEAMDRLTFVHSRHGKFDLDLSLSSIEETFGALFTRVHRSWLVNATSVRELERDGGETRLFVGTGTSEGHDGIHVPVARERAQSIRELLLTNATGLRRM